MTDDIFAAIQTKLLDACDKLDTSHADTQFKLARQQKAARGVVRLADKLLHLNIKRAATLLELRDAVAAKYGIGSDRI